MSYNDIYCSRVYVVFKIFKVWNWKLCMIRDVLILKSKCMLGSIGVYLGEM